MKRNDRTTITALQFGDRFHLLSDKLKTPWTKTPHDRHPQEQNWALKDGDKFPQMVRLSTALVFLRAAQVDAQ